MKPKSFPKFINPQDSINKLILHFNIDRTIIMRDSLSYDNSDIIVSILLKYKITIQIREILSELIWGKVEKNNNGESVFKVIHKELEYDKSKVPADLISFADYLNNKYQIITYSDYQKIEAKEKTLEEMNSETEMNRVKELCEITEANHPGAKFKRLFEDMRKKLTIDAKIKKDYFPESEPPKEENKENEDNNQKKLDANKIIEEKSKKFTELNEDAPLKEKFKYIFNSSYHRIIISFFTMIITLKKLKQDFVLVFRFFGSDESSIEEFVYEFNSFCDCLHPRFCGEYGYEKFKFDVEKEKKEYKLDTKTQEFISVSYRGAKEEEEKFFFETMQQPNFHEIEELREAIEEYYTDSNNQGSIQPSTGYRDIYLTFMEKISQNSSFCILDDYSYFINNGKKHGKLLLIDPYDPDTLQIFFDIELDKYPEKIDVVDIVTHKFLSRNYYLNKFVVNVEPYKAIIDINYFLKKIEECIHNRKSELIKMQGKELPIIPKDQSLNYYDEMNHLPGDIYLEMTVLPLLQNALNMCDMIRPPDPISFIANFMLINKDMAKKLEDVIKELPQKKDNKYKKIELLVSEEVKNEKFDDELEKERLEKERLEKERLEKERIEKEKAKAAGAKHETTEEGKKGKEDKKEESKESTKKMKSKAASKASINSKK